MLKMHSNTACYAKQNHIKLFNILNFFYKISHNFMVSTGNRHFLYKPLSNFYTKKGIYSKYIKHLPTLSLSNLLSNNYI